MHRQKQAEVLSLHDQQMHHGIQKYNMRSIVLPRSNFFLPEKETFRLPKQAYRSNSTEIVSRQDIMQAGFVEEASLMFWIFLMIQKLTSNSSKQWKGLLICCPTAMMKHMLVKERSPPLRLFMSVTAFCSCLLVFT